MCVGFQMTYRDGETLRQCVRAMMDVEELDPRSALLLSRLEEALARHGRVHEIDATTKVVET